MINLTDNNIKLEDGTVAITIRLDTSDAEEPKLDAKFHHYFTGKINEDKHQKVLHALGSGIMVLVVNDADNLVELGASYLRSLNETVPSKSADVGLLEPKGSA